MRKSTARNPLFQGDCRTACPPDPVMGIRHASHLGRAKTAFKGVATAKIRSADRDRIPLEIGQRAPAQHVDDMLRPDEFRGQIDTLGGQHDG